MRLIESIKNLENINIAWSFKSVSLWANAEVASGLLVCCFPVLPRLFKARSSNSRRDDLIDRPPSRAKGRRDFDDSLLHSKDELTSVGSSVPTITQPVSLHLLHSRVSSFHLDAFDLEKGFAPPVPPVKSIYVQRGSRVTLVRPVSTQ